MASIATECIPSVTGGEEEEGEGDPHANYRIDKYTYLAIDGVTGEYSISYYKPKEIPPRFQITLCKKSLGLLRFKVVEDGADTHDIVYVGTIMVRNGFAYISGKPLFLEEPPIYLKLVWFPPFAVTFPLEQPPGITRRDFIKQVVQRHRDKLIKSIEASGNNDTTMAGMLDFDMNTKLGLLYPPHPTCTTCNAKLLLSFEKTSCPVCDDLGRGQVELVEAVREMKAEIKNLSEANKALIKKVGSMTEELEKSNRMVARLAEQLQADNADPDDVTSKKRRRVSGSEDADKV